MKTTAAPNRTLTPPADMPCIVVRDIELARCREAERLRALADLVDAAMAADGARIRLVHLVNPDPLEAGYAA